MSRRELGSLVLVSFLLVGGFYYAKFSYLNALDTRALLAQTATGASGSAAPAQSTSSGARTECKGGETLTVTVGADGVTSSGACNLPTNTCKVIVTAPDKRPGVVTKCCNPEDGTCRVCLHPSEPASSCNKVYPMKNAWQQAISPYKYKCTLSSTKSSMVAPVSQVAAVVSAEPEPIDCNTLNERISQSSAPGHVSVVKPESPAATLPPAAQIQRPPTQTRPVEGAFNTQTPAAPPAAAATPPAAAATPPASSGGSNSGSTFSPAGNTFAPGQSAGLPTGNQAAPITPPPGYNSYPQYPTSQTTFGDAYPSDGYRSGNARSGNGLVSGLASLIGGLFSVPANTVVTYIQTFVGASQPAKPTNPAPTRPQNPAQVLVVLPYPMPSAPTSDIYAQIRAAAKQGNETLGASGVPVAGTSRGDNAGAPVPASSAADGRPEATTSGKEGGQVTAKPQTRAEVEAAFMAGTRATSTEGTSTPRLQRREPDVVEIGVAVDITDPASYESILAYINGDWTHVLRTAVQNKAALAQAESERESIVAHIGALQEAREAGICDAMCTSALSALQRDLPEWQSRVDTLETAVRNDAAPQPFPPPTGGQISRVAESLAEPAYQASEVISPRSASSPPAAVSVASQETPATSGEVKGEATVLRIVRSVWDFLKSWFLPSPQAQAPKGTCSLFLSLFGKCK